MLYIQNFQAHNARAPSATFFHPCEILLKTIRKEKKMKKRMKKRNKQTCERKTHSQEF